MKNTEKKDFFDKRVEDFGQEVEQLGKKAGEKIKEATSYSEETKGTKKTKRLYRSGKEKILGGVCGGIAEYLNVDPVLIRLLWVGLVLVGGTGVLLYLIAWIIIPRNPKHKWDD